MDIQQELTEQERAVVAARLLVEQRERFDGVRKAAYLAAGVNPATWARATAGDRVRPDRLVMIVKSLWPESRGNWDLVPDGPTSSWRPSEYSGPTWVADMDDPWVPGQVQLKNYVDEVVNDVEESLTTQIGELEERVRELERMLLEVVDPEEEGGGEHDRSAATSEPGSGPEHAPIVINEEEAREAARDHAEVTPLRPDDPPPPSDELFASGKAAALKRKGGPKGNPEQEAD